MAPWHTEDLAMLIPPAVLSSAWYFSGTLETGCVDEKVQLIPVLLSRVDL